MNIHIPAQIVFDFGSAQLRQGTGDILGRAATLAKRSRRIVVTGYTDTIGAATFNKLLSGERALAVKAALVRRRVRATLVRTVAGGETTMFSRRAGPRGRPVTGERGLQLNRRVRVTVYLPEAVVRL